MAAINFPASPSNGDTHQGFVYNATLGVWQSAGTQTAVTSFAGLSDTPSTLGTAGQIAKVNSGATALEFADQSGVTVYANMDALPGSGNTGDLAFVTATNRLYIWNGSGWYNIALINTTPSISGVNSSYSLAIDGTATVITITAVDAEGLPITYSIASDTSGNAATVVQGTGANTNVFTITPSTNTANAGTFSLTFRASDGVNIASAVSEFTLQFNVQNQNYTTALITSVGANNAVNNSFDDKSASNHTITANGDAKQTTFSPYRHGGYSTYFDGSGDRLDFATSTAFTMGTGDFTIELWYLSNTSYASANGYLLDLGTNGTRFQLYNNNLYFIPVAGSSITGPAGDGMLVGTWYHIAAVRSGSTLTLYLNGVSIGSVSNSSNLTDNDCVIADYGGGSANFNGYISDLRIVKGTAVYTSNFTPPTERLTAITNTSLLVCHLPYIADGSTNNHAITINGNTSTQPFAPYDAQEYAAGSHGGSLRTPGNATSSINVASSADLGFGTGDFTVEWWVYFNTISNYPYHFDMRAAGVDPGLAIYVRSNLSDRVGAYVNGVNLLTGTYSFLPKQWIHYAVCKTGGYLKGYYNGKQDFSITDTRDYGSSKPISIGRIWDAANHHSDYSISDFHIVKGTAVYTAEFTPPTEPLTAITNTKLLVQSTDAGIIDKSQSNKFLTLSGDAKSSTTQSKYLSSSMYFDGSGDNILTDVMTTGGDFTVEMWIRFDGSVANPASQSPTFFVWGTTTFMLYCTIANNTMQMIGNGSGLISGTTTISADTWYHVAFARQGSTGRLFVNGNLEGSTTSFSTNLNARAVIGSEEGAGYPLKGYISDLRVTKGLARYTSAFTAPAAALQG